MKFEMQQIFSTMVRCFKCYPFRYKHWADINFKWIVRVIIEKTYKNEP